MKRILMCSISLCLVSGCTTQLNAVHLDGTETSLPVSGAPYNLTFTQFKGKFIRRVTECPDQSDPTIKISADLAATQQADPARNYVIDLASLQSFFKTTDVKLAYYDTGALKSINVSAEDKSAEFALKLLEAVPKIIALPKDAKTFVPCTADTKAAVARLKRAEDKLDDLSDQMSAITDQLKQYGALISVLNNNLRKSGRDEIAKLIVKLSALQEQHRTLSSAVAKDLAHTSVVTKFAWPDDGDTLVLQQPIPAIDKPTQLRWFGAEVPQLASKTAFHVALAPKLPWQRNRQADTAAMSDQGIKYRLPVLGEVVVCDYLIDADDGSKRCATPEPVTKPVLISQLGNTYKLDLKSTWFSNKTIALAFSEQGVPTSLGLASAAASDKLAATLSGAVDAGVAIRKTQADRELTALETKNKLLKLQKENRELSQALAPLEPDPRTGALAGLTIDNALLNAEIANIEARRTLEDLSKK
jgi:hypothetical protein